MTRPHPSDISRAVVIWTGWGVAPIPLRDDAEVTAAFGSERAPALLEHLRDLVEIFYSSGARLTIAELDTMAAAAAADFHERHPGISGDAVRALAWCYAFDFK